MTSMEEENIKVAIRIRPIQRAEIKEGDIACVKPGVDGKEVQVKVGPLDAYVYRCNRCFSNDTSQISFFDECGITSLLDSAMKGYRTCAFAFGQTGAGKTYTMFGYPKIANNTSNREKQNGLIQRSLEYLFTNLEASNANCSIKLCCTEIFHEQVYDLFSDEKDRTPLVIREHATDGFFLEGCKLIECQNYETSVGTLDIAVRNRQIGAHDLNSRSSRSHCLIEIYIDVAVPVTDDGMMNNADYDNYENKHQSKNYISRGKISLVDLAGSERLKSTKSTGKVLQEAGFINKSLYVLGKVIAGLVRTNGDLNHKDVPYRDSKLTKLLISSLHGRCRTLLVSCVSEAKTSQAETLRTLKFSMSCARIRNKPLKFLDPQQKLILDLKEEIKRLRHENRKLRTNLLTAPASGEKVLLHLEVNDELEYRSAQNRVYSAHSILAKKKNQNKFKTKNGGKVYGIQKLSPIKYHKMTKQELYGKEVMSLLAENDDTSTASILSSNQSITSKRSGHYEPTTAEIEDLVRRGGCSGPMVFKKKKNGNQSSNITISPIRETSLVDLPPAQNLMRSMEALRLEKLEKRLEQMEKIAFQQTEKLNVNSGTQSMPLISNQNDNLHNNIVLDKKVKKKKKKTVNEVEVNTTKYVSHQKEVSPYIAHLVKNKIVATKTPIIEKSKSIANTVTSISKQIPTTETKISQDVSKGKSLHDSIEDELEALGLGSLQSSVVSKVQFKPIPNNNNHRLTKVNPKPSSKSSVILPLIVPSTVLKNEVKLKSNKISNIDSEKLIEKLPNIIKVENLPFIEQKVIKEVVSDEKLNINHHVTDENDTNDEYGDDFDPIDSEDVRDLAMSSPTQKEQLKTKLLVLESSLAKEREKMEDNPGDVTANAEEQYQEMSREVKTIRMELNIVDQLDVINKRDIESPEPTPKAVKDIELQLTQLNHQRDSPNRSKSPQIKSVHSHDDEYADDYDEFEEDEEEVGDKASIVDNKMQNNDVEFKDKGQVDVQIETTQHFVNIINDVEHNEKKLNINADNDDFEDKDYDLEFEEYDPDA